MYYALHYTLAEDYLQKRQEYRGLHFEYITPYHDRGQLLMGGAFDDSSEGALLIFRLDDITLLQEFAKNDPYVLNGVVTSWKISQWNVAIGDV